MIDSRFETTMYHIPWLFSVYSGTVMKEVKTEMARRGVRFRRRGESGNCLVSCMQMTWFCVVSRKKT